MATPLPGSTILLGAASPPQTLRITRPAQDTTTDYTDAAVRMQLFQQSPKGVPLAEAPTLTLTEGNGLTRDENTPEVVSFTLQFTSAHLETLLGDAQARRIGYLIQVQPMGYLEYQGLLEDSLNCWFAVARQGYAGNEAVKVG